MALAWVSKSWALHLAERPFGTRGMAHLAVECLGETGWKWHVWDASHHVRMRQGSASTQAEAKAQAEWAASEMARASLQAA